MALRATKALRAAFAALLLGGAHARARASDCPNCAPVPVAGALPWFSPVASDPQSGLPGFAVADSPRFHNRPLYGAHTGGLVIAGDRPITHLADDHVIYGGLLLGLRRGAVAVWAHDADALNSSFSGGAARWTLRDSRLPGLALSAAVYAAADGVGFALEANVTDEIGDGGAELVWAFGCGAAQGGQAVGWQKDPLTNPGTIAWDFSPSDCKGNAVALGAANASATITLAGGSVGVSVATSFAAASNSLAVKDASTWANISSLLGLDEPADPLPDHPASARATALPLAGATLWLRAASLAPGLANGSSVALWRDESGSGADFSQASQAQQPVFLAGGFGAGAPGVVFDGAATFLTSATAAHGAAVTMMAVLRDDGSTTNCCSGAVFFNGSFNGISTLEAPGAADDDDGGNVAAGAAIVTTLDFQGSPAYGHANIRGRAVVASSVYSASGPSFSLVDGCVQYTAAVAGSVSSGGAQLGKRWNDVPRFFRGALAEVVVFPRTLNASELAAMHAYFFAAYPAIVPKKHCAPSAGSFAVGRSSLPSAAGATTAFAVAVTANAAPAADPAAVLTAARARALRLATRASSATPDALIDAALPAMSLAVDGLFRADPGAFVHGAMAWDSLYLGWRSEYGATVFGSPELVAQEGRFFFAQQLQDSNNSKCHSDPARRYTDEAPDSRFHGKGRIDANGNIYDMQTQFFDQQIHLWRWTSNATHEALLRPALKLHVEWARDSFDSDGNGLYSSYQNTWPTDSQFYSGGETWEETSYMFRAHLALRDMALRAGNASEAAEYAASAEAIRAAAPQLWVQSLGLPASHREEGGHRRLRPDPWLYSVFNPIEARGLWDAETAAQALHFTEWGLERDALFCISDPSVSNDTCGEVVWTSNWVPSMHVPLPTLPTAPNHSPTHPSS